MALYRTKVPHLPSRLINLLYTLKHSQLLGNAFTCLHVLYLYSILVNLHFAAISVHLFTILIRISEVFGKHCNVVIWKTLLLHCFPIRLLLSQLTVTWLLNYCNDVFTNHNNLF